MKDFIRVLGIDDGYFKPKFSSKAVLVGVVFRLDGCVEGIVSEKISVDGLDATAKIVKMVLNTKYKEQISFILLSGANFAGFNVVDIKKLYSKTGLPVIAVQRKKPWMERIFSALKNFPDFEKRKKLFERMGEIHPFKNIFFQCFGIDTEQARELLSKTLFYSSIPEPLRLAHLIASGTTTGESTRPK